MKYSLGAYNKFDDKEQWIRITEGCPHHHEFCYEPTDIKVFGIPEIVRNTVRIMDMNLLCKKESFMTALKPCCKKYIEIVHLANNIGK